MASAALTPCSGNAEACAALPDIHYTLEVYYPPAALQDRFEHSIDFAEVRRLAQVFGLRLDQPGVEERVTRGWDAHLLRFPSL